MFRQNDFSLFIQNIVIDCKEEILDSGHKIHSDTENRVQEKSNENSDDHCSCGEG